MGPIQDSDSVAHVARGGTAPKNHSTAQKATTTALTPTKNKSAPTSDQEAARRFFCTYSFTFFSASARFSAVSAPGSSSAGASMGGRRCVRCARATFSARASAAAALR